MEEKFEVLYNEIQQYAAEKGLTYTQKALPLIRECMSGKARSAAAKSRYRTELLHCFEVSSMLIDLRLNIPPEEEDTLLAAVLLHIYPENFAVEDMEGKLVREWGFSPAICNVVETITPERDLPDEEQRQFYERVQQNRLALLAALADRGNIVQQLHRFSTWNAHRYIDETKACYYPMCIYGKEHYYELLAPISVLMEKMRSLIEVAEILLRRYEIREAELMQDILALREENATIKGIIAKFKA